MELALAEAEAAAARGEVPVGAALVDADGRVVAAWCCAPRRKGSVGRAFPSATFT